MIPYGKQFIEQDDIDAVIKTLTSDYLTQGPKVAEFEKAICEYTGAKYAVAVSNGTAALHIAVASLEVEGGEGITSPITFAASSNAFCYNDIKPVFADIDPDTYNITSETIRNVITDKTRIITPVHFAGQACEMSSIKELAEDKNLYVIEDAAHAIGSNYPCGDKVGSCKYSDLTIFSFHPVKTVTTGEGGLITTNNIELYNKLLLLRSHGITKDPTLLKKNPGPWYYEMHDLGFNYRLCDLQAALGVSQLNKLERFKKRRKEIILKYNEAFKDVSWLKTPFELEGNDSCFHLYILQFDFKYLEFTRSEVMAELREKGILTQVHYIPVHLQPYYMDKFNYKEGDFPIAEDYYSKALSIPLYPKMSDDDIFTVVSAIKALND